MGLTFNILRKKKEPPKPFSMNDYVKTKNGRLIHKSVINQKENNLGKIKLKKSDRNEKKKQIKSFGF